MRQGGGRDIGRIAIAVVILAAEIAQLSLFAKAFGAEVAAVFAVRLLLTIVLTVLFLRKNTVARMILGSLRVMTFCVAFIMATDLSGWLAWALGGVAVIDGATGLLLLLLPFRA